ncbi:hypothetical protein AVEN_184389-1 [Araneus ventricosus]|uniref:Uncharacterized protein n=1 Tax=Araneus ventricosus TaxID=182803 RepID=A0A4Y2BGA2_ARAVE|nr:hypothetical protein AVEN_184389-1 [Araneus ventricosus]
MEYIRQAEMKEELLSFLQKSSFLQNTLSSIDILLKISVPPTPSADKTELLRPMPNCWNQKDDVYQEKFGLKRLVAVSVKIPAPSENGTL